MSNHAPLAVFASAVLSCQEVCASLPEHRMLGVVWQIDRVACSSRRQLKTACVVAEIVKVHFLESTVLHMALGMDLAGPYPRLPSLDELKPYVIDKNPRLRQQKAFN